MPEQDGWEDVTDPVEVKKVLGQPGIASLMKQSAAGSSTKDSRVADAQNALDAIDRAAAKSNWWSTGLVGQNLSEWGGTDAYDLKRQLDTVNSSLALGKLMEMKAASTTGASGLGSTTEKEMDLLKSTVASLDQAQSQQEFNAGLAKVREHYVNFLKSVGVKVPGKKQTKAPDQVKKPITPSNIVDAAMGSDQTFDEGAYSGATKLPDGKWEVSYPDGRKIVRDTLPPLSVDVHEEDKGPDISDRRGKDNAAEGLDAVMRGVADTATLGLADEITAGANTLFGDGTMRQNLARERAIDDYDAQNSPWLRGGGQLAGGIMLPFGSGARTIGQMATTGGTLGALYGAGSGRDWTERSSGAVVGGLTGAALGAGFGKLSDLYQGRTPPPGGGSAQGAADVLSASRDLGVDMLPADAGGALTRYATTGARAMPGSIGPITRAAQRIQRQAGHALDTIAAREGTAMDAEAAGNAVREGALKYRSASRNSIARMYDDAAAQAGNARVTPAKALASIDRNIADLGEVPGGADGLAVLQTLRDEIAKRGTITVNGVRGMRTQLRQKFAKDNLRGSDIERRVNDVVEAASEDLLDSLSDQGKAAAARAYAQADQEWKRRITALDDVIMPIIGKKGEKSGEQIVQGLNAAAKGNNARLSKLFEVLPEDEAGTARATLIQQMGRSSSGGQNAKGDEFSFNTFLTNWDKIGGSAKNTIFRGENRKAIDQLALIAERSKAAAKYQNYSNTGIVTGGAVTAGTAFSGALTLGKVLAAQYAAGRLLASPNVARGLLNIAKAKTPEAVRTRISGLSQIATKESALSGEILGLQKRLLDAMNDNVSSSAASGDKKDER